MVISGGTATLLGPIAGAAIVVVMKNVASAYIERWNFVLGVDLRRHRHLHAGRARARLRCGSGAGPATRAARGGSGKRRRSARRRRPGDDRARRQRI